ncbi:hypothetical protein HPB49_023413 [Dermacentor silvarum]|uniref:Uncharacterized protein n=1 Tax=Dermacentor silvarum TaxID=543639 RepID=A0ACB8CND1_DERSI|nr:hypothetical protein HPB49_023413 [Dermacentor silvarum]
MLSASVSHWQLPTQVPPLTPGTNQKMTQALTASFSSWEKERETLNIPKDPRQWTEMDVAHWLGWAIREFSLEGVNMPSFAMKGKDMCALGKESFLTRFPPFMGDILWEHLDILQKGTPPPLLSHQVGHAAAFALVHGTGNKIEKIRFAIDVTQLNRQVESSDRIDC